MSLAEAEIIIDVQFYDLDPMNVVWHGNYVKYTETARCALLDKIGYDYEDMKKDGVVYPIAKMEMKFIKSATFGQKLKAKAFLESVEPSLNIKYVIEDAVSKEVLFKAKTMQIYVDIKSGESVYEAPEKFKKAVVCLKNI